MLKTQVSASLQAGLTQQLNRSLTNEDSSSLVSSIRNGEGNVNYITFNQDASCVAIGLNSGYKIFNCKPLFGKCFQFKKEELIGIVEMLYCTSLIAVVALGDEPGSSPRKLKLVNTKRLSTICDLIFPSTILQVKLTNSRLVVLLEEQIYIYDITTMKLLHTIETSPNLHGLCTISPSSDQDGNSYLAYPSPPKTITHDSLLVTGINTNGGSNSVQNNIQSVSNSPNRVGDVIIFNLTTLQPLSVIEAHKSTLAAMTLSNDGSLLATASDKGTIVRVFSVETGVKLYQFRRGTYPTKIYSLSFSSDDKYVVATSSSETVHIFRLSQEEALENKHKLKKLNNTSKKKVKLNPEYETIAEENETLGEQQKPPSQVHDDDFDDIQDDGDDSDAVNEEDDIEEEDEDASSTKQRKLSQSSTNSFQSVNSGKSIISNEDVPTNTFPKDNSSLAHKSEPIIDQNRLSVARLIRRSSQTLGRKAAQKMGDFLPSRFSSILEPTRHFASLKINAIGKDVKSIAVMNNELLHDFVPQAYLAKDRDGSSPSTPTKDNSFLQREAVALNLLHINVVTSEGFFYTYGLDPERGGDCILLHQYSLLDDGA
ncbi:autophagy-related protein 18 [Suhomyces tanzawaensis NRRL Y-17324]|uniref:Autophagy-related protein 18 n=1 Tax=Suhomyces tanzawaensis NRRL Y-17324 TaxID=984487 RepID=A0A1E4SLI4_9ASCO|nr:autophagy-related protein 18 [Suhomyces tanzawaensis NRRL Y-17324]ODV80395.1 autophagy-related protein 18 [Suhomyces tanzawaensis NRRL Y-17324]